MKKGEMKHDPYGLASTTGMRVVLRIEMEIIIIRVGLVVAGN